MADRSAVSEAAEVTARGAVRGNVQLLEDRMDEATDRFKREAANKVEDLARQIRELGDRFGRHGEAHGIARRLERTSDYLRYRPTSEVAGDAWEKVTESRLLWIAGGVAAGLLIYKALRRER